MSTIRFEEHLGDDARRSGIYAGHIFVYAPRPSTLGFCDFARRMLVDAFYPLDPATAHLELPVARYAAVLAELKPTFIHAPEAKTLLAAILKDFGCDPERTYFDVPRLRTSTPDGYLTTGIAYAFHPHRDTWYSAPQCQLNWWIAVDGLRPDNGLAFHPRYWSQPIKNGSRLHDYAEWKRTARVEAAKQIGQDTRVQPRAEEAFDAVGEFRPICAPGGLILFSGAQMHSSVENTSKTSRMSIDFRTVHLDEVEAGTGAPNIDSECTGSTLSDFMRCTDLQHIPAELVERYEQGFGRRRTNA